MTQAADNGGPAFPVKWLDGSIDEGMSLRDYFAGQALGHIINLDATNSGGGTSAFEMLAGNHIARITVADLAYAVADAMLAARKGGAE